MSKISTETSIKKKKNDSFDFESLKYKNLF